MENYRQLTTEEYERLTQNSGFGRNTFPLKAREKQIKGLVGIAGLIVLMIYVYVVAGLIAFIGYFIFMAAVMYFIFKSKHGAELKRRPPEQRTFRYILGEIKDEILGKKSGAEIYYDKKSALERKDLKERLVRVRNIQITDAWKVFDPGYNTVPDILLRTKNNEFICFASEDIGKDDFAKPKSTMIFEELKHSRLPMRTEFSGETLKISNKTLDAKNEWRNDDLPYAKLFPAEALSENLKQQIGS